MAGLRHRMKKKMKRKFKKKMILTKVEGKTLREVRFEEK